MVVAGHKTTALPAGSRFIRKHMHKTYYVLYKDHKHEWRWTFHAGNGLIIAVSSESYVNKQDCLHGIGLISTSGQSLVHER